MAIKTVRLAAWLLDQVRKSRRLAECGLMTTWRWRSKSCVRRYFGVKTWSGLRTRTGRAAMTGSWVARDSDILADH